MRTYAKSKSQIVTMKSIKNKEQVNIDSCNDSTGQELLLNSQNVDSNTSVDENNSALVASSQNDFEDLKKSHKIPIVTVWCLMELIYAIVNHVHDFVSDIRLIIDYFENKKTIEGSLTLAFTILQAITTAWISSLMHHPKLGEVSADDENEDEKPEETWFKRLAKIARSCIMIIGRMILPHCLVRRLYFSWQLRNCQRNGDENGQKHYHQKMLKEDKNLAWLEVVECFIESAPQLGLQLYILITTQTAINTPMWSKIVSGCLKLIGFGKIMKKYHCAIRSAHPDKSSIGRMGGILLFLWHFGTIAARIFVFGVSAQNWLSYTLFACFVNWVIWSIWIYAKENEISVLFANKIVSPGTSQTTLEKIQKRLLAGVLAAVYLFTFVNLGKKPTFIRNSFYYILCLLQNGTVVVLWFTVTNSDTDNIWFSRDLLILAIILFFTGISAMVTYYLCFHPTVRTGACELEACHCLTCIERRPALK